MVRTFFTGEPMRVLRGWVAAQPAARTFDITWPGDGTYHVEAHDLEPCPARGAMVAITFHGYGRSLAEAADRCLIAITDHRTETNT